MLFSTIWRKGPSRCHGDPECATFVSISRNDRCASGTVLVLSVVNLLAWIADVHLWTIKKADVSDKKICILVMCIINMHV